MIKLEANMEFTAKDQQIVEVVGLVAAVKGIMRRGFANSMR